MKLNKNILIPVLSIIVFFGSCRKRDNTQLADNYVSFETAQQGLAPNENSIVVRLKMAYAVSQNTDLVIGVVNDKILYNTGFTSVPAVNSNEIHVSILAGSDTASFKINKVAGVFYDGTEIINFKINSTNNNVKIGVTNQFKLTFAEFIATTGSLMLNGGGASFGNKVFIDLSANRQTSVLRTNWDLQFYNDPSDFKVLLNQQVGMMVKQINKTDLNTVTASDTLGFSSTIAYSSYGPTPNQLAFVDYPNGDLTRTAIGKIDSIANNNKVFIVNRGTVVGTTGASRGWKKIRILRNTTGGYSLQYADIAATSFTSLDVPKTSNYFFNYVHFENGIVNNIEPEKLKWDIAWSFGASTTNFGGEVPYLFQDLISQNRNVQVAKILTSTIAYTAFTEANLLDPSIVWSGQQLSIGAGWRFTSPAPAGVYTDRFYIIKDGSNNYYKLKFTALSDGGIRGYPSFEFALVKKG